jgi:hypothetical protein
MGARRAQPRISAPEKARAIAESLNLAWFTGLLIQGLDDLPREEVRLTGFIPDGAEANLRRAGNEQAFGQAGQGSGSHGPKRSTFRLDYHEDYRAAATFREPFGGLPYELGIPGGPLENRALDSAGRYPGDSGSIGWWIGENDQLVKHSTERGFSFHERSPGRGER